VEKEQIASIAWGVSRRECVLRLPIGYLGSPDLVGYGKSMVTAFCC